MTNKRSPMVEEHIDQSLIEYPTLYGKSRILVLNQLLVTNGNGYEWSHDGGIASIGSHRIDRTKKRAKAIHRAAIAFLEKIPVVTQKRVREVIDDHDLIWTFPETEKADEEKWIKFRESEFQKLRASLTDRGDNIDVQMYQETLAKSIHMCHVDLKQFSLLAHPPKNVRRDYVHAIAETLLACLQYPSSPSQESNEGNTLIHIYQFQKLFKEHDVHLPFKEVIASKAWRKARSLELDCRRHVGNHSLDESKLNDEEFYALNHMNIRGLSNHERTLVRRYRQYLDWEKEYSRIQTTQQNKDGRKKNREFWNSVTIKKDTLTAKLTPETKRWAEIQKIIYALRIPIVTDKKKEDDGLEKAKSAKRAAKNIFAHIGKVSGIGITKLKGKYVLQVNIPKAYPPKTKVPTSVKGVPVILKVTGPIKKQTKR